MRLSDDRINYLSRHIVKTLGRELKEVYGDGEFTINADYRRARRTSPSPR